MITLEGLLWLSAGLALGLAGSMLLLGLFSLVERRRFVRRLRLARTPPPAPPEKLALRAAAPPSPAPKRQPQSEAATVRVPPHRADPRPISKVKPAPPQPIETALDTALLTEKAAPAPATEIRKPVAPKAAPPKLTVVATTAGVTKPAAAPVSPPVAAAPKAEVVAKPAETPPPAAKPDATPKSVSAMFAEAFAREKLPGAPLDPDKPTG